MVTWLIEQLSQPATLMSLDPIELDLRARGHQLAGGKSALPLIVTAATARRAAAMTIDTTDQMLSDFDPRLLHARSTELSVSNEQDRAALASDAPAFVHSVRDSITAFRQIAITATVSGATRCIL